MGVGGVKTGNLVIEMVVDVWHLTELLYKVAPTHLEGGPACAQQPALRHTAVYFAFTKHGSKVLVPSS